MRALFAGAQFLADLLENRLLGIDKALQIKGIVHDRHPCANISGSNSPRLLMFLPDTMKDPSPR